MKYFVLSLDMNDETREGTWSISDYPVDGNGLDIKPWLFHGANLWNGTSPVIFHLITQGSPMPVDMPRGAPLVNNEVLKILKPFLNKSVQIIPALVKVNESTTLKYNLLNVLEMPDCLDLQNSEYYAWDRPIADYENPLGMGFRQPAIYKNKVTGLHFFRLKNWGLNRLVVDEQVKNALNATPYLKYVEVTLIGQFEKETTE